MVPWNSPTVEIQWGQIALETWAKMLPVQKCFNLNLNNSLKFNLKLK